MQTESSELEVARDGNSFQNRRYYALKKLYETVSVKFVDAEDKIREHEKYGRILKDKISNLKKQLSERYMSQEEVYTFLRENIRIDQSIAFGGQGSSTKLSDDGYKYLASALTRLPRRMGEEQKMSIECIKKHYDEFLGYYYNSSCSGCKDGHASFWKTITESDEWKKWKASNPMYDFAECEELGLMGDKHFKAFITFITSQALGSGGKP